MLDGGTIKEIKQQQKKKKCVEGSKSTIRRKEISTGNSQRAHNGFDHIEDFEFSLFSHF